MKELKNKEVIIGLIVIIILSIIAIVLIVQRELKSSQQSTVTVQVEETIEDVEQNENLTDQTADVENTDVIVNDEDDIEDNESVVNNETESVVTAETTLELEESITIHIDNVYYEKTLVERKTRDQQLEELFSYWDDYQLDAVDELIRLDRFIAISEELEGTHNYYYYGESNASGQPDGIGLAVYADNAYYCGEWSNGQRSGEGMWLQVYIYPDGVAEENRYILEHSYNGTWSNDLPNGSGQEHYEYDLEILPDAERLMNNAIGTFVDGYYHGEMYLMTIENTAKTNEWYGTAKKGVWEAVTEVNENGEMGIWYRTTDENSFYWISSGENTDYGISGMKK